MEDLMKQFSQKSKKISANDIRNNPIVNNCVSHWQGTLDVERLAIDGNASERYKKNLLDFVKNDLELSEIHQRVAELVAKERWCVGRLSREGKVIIDSQVNYTRHRDFQTGKMLYDMTRSGYSHLTNLQHGVEIFVFTDWVSSSDDIAPSRVDSVRNWLELYYYGVQSNAKRFHNGFVGDVLFPTFDLSNDIIAENLLPEIDEETQKDEGVKVTQKKSFIQEMGDLFIDKFTGYKNANRVGIVPGLKDFISPDKSNKDLQTLELVKETLTHVAISFGLSPADLGVGDSTTYNNVASFHYAKHDKIGQHLQRMIENFLNSYVLPQLFNPPKGKVYYAAPADPNKLEKDKEWREDLKVRVITINEYRSQRGLDPVEWGEEVMESQQPNDQIVAAAYSKKKCQCNEKESKTVEFANKKTDLQKNLESAMEKQIIDYSETRKLKPLETFYPFKTLKDNLAVLTQKSLNKFSNDKRLKFKNVKFNKNFANIDIDGFGDLPDFLKLAIEQRTFWLLKGSQKIEADEQINYGMLPDQWQGYAGLDDRTTKEIDKLIAENAELSEEQLAKKIIDDIVPISKSRAKTIARTERANAIQSSEIILYNEELGEHEVIWRTSDDGKVGEDHKENDDEQRVIGQEFPSGETRPAQRPNCRCTFEHLIPDGY